ncbi:furin-like protease 2, partial [Leptotrombidium deliense]
IIDGCYLFVDHSLQKRSLDYSHTHHTVLKKHNDVTFVEQQHIKKRVKRDSGSVNVSPKDPMYKDQWYLHDGARDGYDMNVRDAWKLGYTGKGVVITILDDGIQKDHPDLALNYDPQASYDINDNDPDPYPRDNGDNKHGTRCAGEVSAVANNDYCGVGIAYNSSIGGVRMLDGTVTDEVEARALSLNPNHVHIYSASWGPEDDGKTVDGPGILAAKAFTDGIRKGRNGLGSIYVWASGNGGRREDNCNCDGYTNSIFTLSISSASQSGTKPWYLEECSSTLATTYSSGSPRDDKNIVTVDMDTSYFQSLKSGGRVVTENLCTDSHTGTSASAPIAAGIVALALEANPNLSWRDVQHIVVRSSRSSPLMHEDGWALNGVKRKYSHKFGYGLMDATAMVKLAKKWKAVPSQRVCHTDLQSGREVIPGDNKNQLEVFIKTDACIGGSEEIRHLEHVQARLTLSFAPRGKLKITLVSPSNTSSHLLFPRPHDTQVSDFNQWPFLSVHFWGENPAGTWKLIIKNDESSTHVDGFLHSWRLIFHGTLENPQTTDTNSTHYLPRRTFRTKVPQSICARENKFKSSTSDECLQSCPDGQYGDYETGICKNCSDECETCYGPTADNCLSCKTFFYKSGCVDKCHPDYYGDVHLKECLPCPSRCQTCVNHTTCSSCGENRILNNQSQCVDKCLVEGNCSCDKNCLTCDSEKPSDCTSCPKGLLLHSKKCLSPPCPLGFYEENMECIKCHYSCKTCNGSSHYNCISCDTKSFLNEHGLCLSCPAKQFMNVDTKSCGLCHHTCGSCNGPTATDCTACDPPMFLEGSRCLPCCSNINPQVNDLDFGDVTESDCCRCQTNFGPCVFQEHPRSVNSDNIRIPNAANNENLSLLINNTSAVIITICVTSVLLFVLVFVVLEGVSTNFRGKAKNNYAEYHKLSTNVKPDVMLSNEDGDEEDSLFEKT